MIKVADRILSLQMYEVPFLACGNKEYDHMISMTVMYPNEEGGSFDFDYYLNSHMPMVSDLWTPMGMKSVQVNKGIGGGAPGSDAPYVVVAQVVFDNMEDLQAAQAAHGRDIFHDVANFTNLSPRVQISEIVG